MLSQIKPQAPLLVVPAGIIQHGMVQGGGDRYAYVPFLCVPVVIASFLRKLNGKRNRVACYMCVLILLFSTSELCNRKKAIVSF